MAYLSQGRQWPTEPVHSRPALNALTYHSTSQPQGSPIIRGVVARPAADLIEDHSANEKRGFIRLREPRHQWQVGRRVGQEEPGTQQRGGQRLFAQFVE
jgi:hypothetical protein